SVDATIPRQIGTAVHRLAVAAKYPAKYVRRTGYLRRVAEEAHGRLRGQPLAAAEDLQRYLIPIELDRLRQRLRAVRHLDESHVAQTDVAGADFQKVAHDCRRMGVAQQISQSRRHPIISFGRNQRLAASRRARHTWRPSAQRLRGTFVNLRRPFLNGFAAWKTYLLSFPSPHSHSVRAIDADRLHAALCDRIASRNEALKS